LALPVVVEDPHVGALEPFRAAIAAGVRAVMSAHVVVATIDSVPATISARVMTDLLRQELGFDGLAVSDGLEMRAISDGVGVANGTVLALDAGCDLLCIGGGLAGEDIALELRDAIVAAAREGRLSETRLRGAKPCPGRAQPPPQSRAALGRRVAAGPPAGRGGCRDGLSSLPARGLGVVHRHARRGARVRSRGGRGSIRPMSEQAHPRAGE